MKRLLMIVAIMFSVTILSQTNCSAKIIGITIKIIKGTRTWNADKTDTKCEGKGLCEIEIGGSVGGGSMVQDGSFGFTEDGKLGLSIDATILTNSQWNDTFVDGYLVLPNDVLISRDVISKLRNCPSRITAGKYKYYIDGNQLIVYFH